MAMVRKEFLVEHVKLCKKNLNSGRVKCCASCPFEEFIVEEYPYMQGMFDHKRMMLESEKK